jgi:alpha-1,3-rhamnosyl/mannosyltransferase
MFRLHTRRLKGWLLHTPNYVLMPFDGPALTTVHDLSWLSFPEAHPVERVRFLDRHLPETLARANLVLTDSGFIAAEIAERYGVPREKIRAIPLGVDASYRPRPREEIAPVLARHGLADSAYLLVVATLEPRKNLARLVRAYAALPPAQRARHPLVIAGARGWLSGELEKAIAPLEAKGEARRLGYVGEDELPAIYAGAHAFAFPSLYEGFGLPVLEAMACGVPVLTSNVSSLPEVAGDVALMADPRDDDALRAGLLRVLEDSSWRSGASARGVSRARDYPWSRCVDATVDAYSFVSRP